MSSTPYLDADVGGLVQEAIPLLEDAEGLLLRLERNPEDPRSIDSLFRAIHTLKGTAGITPNAKAIASLAHEFESVLSEVREKRLHVSAQLITVFLKITSTLRKLVEALKTTGTTASELIGQAETCVIELSLLKTGAGSDSREQSGLSLRSSASDASVQADDTILVAAEKLDSLMGVSGEFIVFQNDFQLLAQDAELRALRPDLVKRFENISVKMRKATDRLQSEIMDVRKVSIGHSLRNLPVTARRLSTELGKKVSLTVEGTEVRVDRSIAKAIGQSMLHLLRNSIDHGIERAEDRVRSGKRPEGQISIQARENGDFVTVTIRDDGKGLQRERIVEKAQQLGLVTPETVSGLSETDIWKFIFAPGFSTAENVSSVSGRGVGMDAVQEHIKALHGEIRIESEKGKFTEFKIQLPIPKSVVVEKTLLVRSESHLLAIPLQTIREVTHVNQLAFTEMQQKRFCQHSGQTIRAGNLSELIGIRGQYEAAKPDTAANPVALLLAWNDQMLALTVEKVVGHFDAVIRPFNEVISHLPGFKGTACMGDDEVAYVLNPEDFFSLSFNRMKEAA